MAHQIETMAYANATPWHGLGARVDGSLTAEQMTVAAGLDWQVELRPLLAQMADGTTVPVSNKVALVRETDSRVLDVVGENWKPVQNSEAMRFFKSFVEAGEATMETAGSLGGGRMIWGLANLNTSFTLPGGDKVVGHLLLCSPHQAGKATIAKVVTTRVVCANTMAVALKEQSKFEARFSHRSIFDPEAAREAMGLAREAITEQEKNARLLMKLNLTRDDALRILAPVYQPQEEVEILVRNPEGASRTVRAIMESALTAPGATPGTGWGLLQGITHWSSHVAGRDPDSRLSSVWMGREAERTSRVMSTMLEMAS